MGTLGDLLTPPLLGAIWGSLGSLPPRMRSKLGAKLGALYGTLPSRSRTIAELQLQVFLKDPNYRVTCRNHFANLGRATLESMNLKAVLRDPSFELQVPNQEYLTSILQNQKPGIFFTAHYGNWDLLAAWTVAQGRPLVVVARPARNPHFHTLLRNLRSSYGVETIWRGESSALKAIIATLDRGAIIGAVIDQDTDVRSEQVPFFGCSAKTPSALAELAHRKKIPVASAFISREEGFRFRLHLTPLPIEHSPQEILQEYHRNLEAVVREYPDQWVWLHKRWRTTEPEKTLGTKEYLNWLQKRLGTAEVKVSAPL